MARKILMLMVLSLAISNPFQAKAQEQLPAGMFLIDIILFRPAGLAATIAGSALFVGISPLTAFASIPHPHDAFEKSFEFLINQPAKYTFVRPLGVYYQDEEGRYRPPK